MDRDERQLDRVFEAYREACPAPEQSAGFMPGLWSRIDANRAVSLTLRRWTSAIVTLTAALCIVMAIFMTVPHQTVAVTYSMTYVDTLEKDVAFETMAYSDLVSFETLEALDTE